MKNLSMVREKAHDPAMETTRHGCQEDSRQLTKIRVDARPKTTRSERRSTLLEQEKQARIQERGIQKRAIFSHPQLPTPHTLTHPNQGPRAVLLYRNREALYPLCAIFCPTATSNASISVHRIL